MGKPSSRTHQPSWHPPPAPSRGLFPSPLPLLIHPLCVLPLATRARTRRRDFSSLRAANTRPLRNPSNPTPPNMRLLRSCLLSSVAASITPPLSKLPPPSFPRL